MKNNSPFFAAIILFPLYVIMLTGCSDSSKDPVTGTYDSGRLKINFDNVVDNQQLILNEITYKNKSNEDFVVTKFNYFISNIRLTKNDGTVCTIPQDSSYFLIQEDEKATQVITLNGIPTGEYKAVEFMVGVDSLRNTAPLEKRKGVLDPGGSSTDDGMYWAWNSGYIFLKLEGISSQGNPVNGKFYYHIGLFGGYNERTVNNTRTVKLDFTNEKTSVGKDSIPEISILVDVQKVFDGPGTSLKIEEYNSIMGGQPIKAEEVANNYAHMFTLDSIN
ncbi:MbnP family protein [Dyadobacter bucti]|uniref:MbnP family protein n=1 Tax=Dyadobacter bucti TaxID=2572203 RepID=UPI003F6E624B